ncbi:glutathione ABC transporter substrate-binding protein [Salisediminibacterium selenitireducens]|uniref:Extracellular solute-binding protein family 5 n=1 Tax=Bacillus selenitireducens (strain ATCC 700615 / DSM 15326 / MLS10) TaxID=439292 RepID=D6Y1G3_BACIE|nr:glutathione ABC transporter substrate-binding protein [Salisediminibacterium selenitireducens]ADI00750.1 extracellular solute-binding protein family 5 [[Bacillus] selenitireducens MLS10]
MFRSKTLKAGLLSAAAVMTFTACASEPDNDGGTVNDSADNNNAADNNGNNDAGDDEAAPAGDNDLVIAVLSDADSLDAHGSNDVPSSNIQVNIYEPLLSQTEDGDLEPLLATDWEAVEDDLWEFTLREGVTFHDGSELTADVVKANFDRVLDPDVASPRAFLYDMIEEVIVVDDLTVQFQTEFPFAPLPAHIAHSGGAIMSQEVIDADYEAMADGGQPGDYINDNPVGTGFFKFESWTPGDNIVLTRNDDYWGDHANVDSVTFRVVPEDLTRIGELETGSAHIIHPVSPSDTGRVDNMDGASLYQQESLSLAYIGFNMQAEPFDDVLVRQAVSMAINKEDIIFGVMDGTAEPALGPIGPQVFGYSDQVEGLPYDPEQAAELLAEAGYEDGFSTTIWTNDSRERMDIAELVQDQLGDIGVDVEIEVLEWGAYLDETAEGNHDMFILGWTTVTADADYGMYALFHSSQVGSPGNRSFMENEELDAILDEARREADPDVRAALYEDAMEILVEEAPMSYLYHQNYLVGLRDEVQGFWKHPNGLYMIQDVEIQ